MDKKHLHKVKVAFYVGYNGQPFHGLQKTPNAKTIEESIEKSFHELGLISSSNFGTLSKIGWSRGSRTDKGVHAILNVIACKLQLSDEYMKNTENQSELVTDKKEFKQSIDFAYLKMKINEQLDVNIRIFNIFLVTKSFEVRTSAGSRQYVYIFPLSILGNSDEVSDDETKIKFQSILDAFKGSHNFHNYTVKGDPNHSSSTRYMIDIQCQIRSLDSHSSEEIGKNKYAEISIHGQSFMYHQIRKMIGTAIFSYRKNWGDTYIQNSMNKNKCMTFLAPSEGLYLDRILFDSYNKKKDIPAPIEPSAAVQTEIEKFKSTLIYPKIAEVEIKDKTFTQWIEKTEQSIV